MTVISLVSTVLLVTCVASANPISPLKDSTDLYDASILQNREGSADYEPLGCYITRTVMNRKVFKKFTDKSGVPQDCIEIAMKKSYSFFGILQTKLKTGTIQYRCLTGNVENAKTTKYKWPCNKNIGKRGAIFIYKKVSKPVSADYEPLGCYITRTIMDRKVFKKFTDKSGVPQDCIEMAMKKSYSFFGILQKKLKTGTIQYRCLTGNVENAKTTKYKWPCQENIGKSGAIFVYKKVSKPEIKPPPQFCKFENKSYSEGEEVEWYQSNNDTCSACECSGGKFDCRTKLHCDTGLKRCSETYHPPGECCPDCKPNLCEGKKVGDTWFKKGKSWSEKNNEDCVFCQCTLGFQKTCDQVTCLELPLNCKKDEIPEGKCCAECREEEKVTTEPPSFVIILPTTGTPTEFKLPWER